MVRPDFIVSTSDVPLRVARPRHAEASRGRSAQQAQAVPRHGEGLVGSDYVGRTADDPINAGASEESAEPRRVLAGRGADGKRVADPDIGPRVRCPRRTRRPDDPHREARLLEGALFATSSYVDWAVLLHRTFGFDALRCPRCDHRMRIISTVTEPNAVRKILDHLGVRAHPLPRAAARDPTGQTGFDFDAA